MRMLKEIIDNVFKPKKPKPVPVTIYKTRTQLITEGQGAFVRSHRCYSKPPKVEKP